MDSVTTGWKQLCCLPNRLLVSFASIAGFVCGLLKSAELKEAEEATQAQLGRELTPSLAGLLANQALLAPRLTDTDRLVAKCPIRGNESGRPCGNSVVVVVFVGSSHPDLHD